MLTTDSVRTPIPQTSLQKKIGSRARNYNTLDHHHVPTPVINSKDLSYLKHLYVYFARVDMGAGFKRLFKSNFTVEFYKKL